MSMSTHHPSTSGNCRNTARGTLRACLEATAPQAVDAACLEATAPQGATAPPLPAATRRCNPRFCASAGT
eukprot:4918882-Alexandrium_andersonii.AAC.1